MARQRNVRYVATWIGKGFIMYGDENHPEVTHLRVEYVDRAGDLNEAWYRNAEDRWVAINRGTALDELKESYKNHDVPVHR